MTQSPKRALLCFVASFALIIGLSGCTADGLIGPDLGSLVEEVEAGAEGGDGGGGANGGSGGGGSPNEPPPPLPPNNGGN